MLEIIMIVAVAVLLIFIVWMWFASRSNIYYWKRMADIHKECYENAMKAWQEDQDGFIARADKAAARCSELEGQLEKANHSVRENCELRKKLLALEDDLAMLNACDAQRNQYRDERDASQRETLRLVGECDKLTAEAEKWRRERDFFLTLSHNYLADVRVEARKREKLWLFARSLVRQKDEMQRVIIGLQGESFSTKEILAEQLARALSHSLQHNVDAITANRRAESFRSALRRMVGRTHNAMPFDIVVDDVPYVKQSCVVAILPRSERG